MFFLPIGQNSPTRIQGSYINDNEIEKIINFTKNQQEASYDDNLMKLEKEEPVQEEKMDAAAAKAAIVVSFENILWVASKKANPVKLKKW